MAKAADAFLTGRPYGIRLDFKHKGFALFNYNMNELGNHLPGRLETLPLEDFDVEDIPLCGERIVRKENITDIFFYDEKSNPYSDNRVDMKKLKALEICKMETKKTSVNIFLKAYFLGGNINFN